MKRNFKRNMFVATFLFIFLFFVNFIDVKGAAVGNGANYPGGKVGSCAGKNCIWSQQVGIRFSLVDENGNKVAGTHHIDAWVYSKLFNSIKNYDLYTDDNKLIWDFDSAFYGNQIKQEYFASPGTLQQGQYWSLSHIRHLEKMFPDADVVGMYDNRWEAGWIQKVADYIIDNTTDDDTSILDSVLVELGYKEGAKAASEANYYLQYEPIILNGRIGSVIVNYIFIGTPTEYLAYDEKKAGAISPYFAGLKSAGVYIFTDEAPTIFTKGTRNIYDVLSRKDGKIIGEGVAHIWIRDLVKIQGSDCNSIVSMLNVMLDGGKISQTQYDFYITKVIDGTFTIKSPDNNAVYKIDGPQNFELLIKANYEQYNGNKAACANRKVSSQDCEAAIEYINNSNSYPKRSDAYINAVEQVRNGEFSYVLPDGTTVKVDSKYDFNMLNYDVYSKNGWVAKCEDLPAICDNIQGSDVYIDDCETGKSYFKDIDDENAWLTCEVAYTNGSKVYSSDNTGHAAVGGGYVGNTEYCEIFCYEEIETNFPTHVSDVKAGQTFAWGLTAQNFGTIRIKKTCKTQNYAYGQQGYRFEEWEEDYKDNEREMIEHYMNKASYEKMKNNITTSSDSAMTECCDCCDDVPVTCPDGSSGCTSWVCGPNDCEKRYSGTATATGKSHSYNGGSYIGNVTGSVSTESYTTGYVHMTAATAESEAKSELLDILDGLIDDEVLAYGDAEKEQNNLITKLTECTNAIEYKMDTNVQLIFKEPINSAFDNANTREFEFNDNLIREEVVKPDGTPNTSSCKTVNSYTYECIGEGSSATCNPELNQVLDCSSSGVTWDLRGTYKYLYHENEFEWYTYKVDGTLLNKTAKGDSAPDLYYSIGYGLPTALSLTNGIYELKVVVYDIGDNANFTGGNPIHERPIYTHFDPLGTGVDTKYGSKKGFEYICTYEVKNEIFGYDCQYDETGKLLDNSPEYCDRIEDEKPNGSLVGIDIAYRLVALLSDGDSIDKAFPGRGGTGRTPGSNWNLDPVLIADILDADVYDEPAMYEFMLDVNAIQQIRKDNQAYFEAGADPYASYYDSTGTAQKVFCASETTEDGTRKYCSSDFISKLYLGGGYNYPLRGTCLPTALTVERAEHILAKGCDADYTYPEINWTR